MEGPFSFSLILNLNTIVLCALVPDLVAALAWDGRDDARLSEGTVFDQSEQV